MPEELSTPSAHCPQPRSRYRVLAVEHAYWALAARYAVALPLLGREALKESAVPKVISQLRHLWHQRIDQLAEDGWDVARNAENYKSMRNCPPFGVQTSDRARCCNRVNICPFCYARQRVFEPYFNLLWAYYRTLDYFRVVDGEQQPCLPVLDAKLVEFRSHTDLPRPGTRLANILEVMQAGGGEPREVRNYGAMTLVSIDPRPGYIRVSRRGYLICHRDHLLPHVEGRRIRQHQQITRKLLAEVVGRTCRYPATLLTGDVHPAHVVIAASGHAKLLRHYGGLRNETERKTALEFGRKAGPSSVDTGRVNPILENEDRSPGDHTT